MKKVLAKAAIAMAALFAVGVLVGLEPGPLQAKPADTGGAIQRVDPSQTIRPPGTARKTFKRPANPFQVLAPPHGKIVRAGRGSIAVIWKYQGAASPADKRDFWVKVMKHSSRSWSVDLGRNHNVILQDVGAYSRAWAVPNDFTAGGDYFFRIIHIPTGATTHSVLFTIINP